MVKITMLLVGILVILTTDFFSVSLSNFRQGILQGFDRAKKEKYVFRKSAQKLR